MGKNMTIYFDDESLDLIQNIDGKGTLINQLIKDHFSNDEDILKHKLHKAELEANQLRSKLEQKVSYRLERQQEKEKQKEESLEVRKHQQSQKDKLMKLIRDNVLEFSRYMEYKREISNWNIIENKYLNSNMDAEDFVSACEEALVNE